MKLSEESDTQLNYSARNNAVLFSIALLLAIGIGAWAPAPALGDTAEQIQQKIAEQNAQIAALEKEIAQYETQLTAIGGQKKTLQSEIDQLDISRKKTAADISVTQRKITETNLQIQQLGGAIDDKQKRVDSGKGALLKSFRSIYETEDTTLVEHLFTATGLTQAWDEIDKEAQLQGALQTEITDLLATKQSLTEDLTATQKKQAQLKSLRAQLTGQKQVLDQNRKDQAQLLADTKNKESLYQAQLKAKQDAKAAFEKQLTDYESQLKFNLDPSVIPRAGSGVFIFPVDPEYMARCAKQATIYGNIYCITQYFGNTSFAASGAYNGKGHNGIDIGVPTGTKIVAPLTGTVLATGNTDLQRGCYSYGKWVLLQHSNGLATLYGHLSVISVTAGDAVPTGGLLGYSGKTGYATGPHLHFTVYVGSAVKVVRYGDVVSKTNCGNVSMPIAPTEAYLNPISYL